MPERLNDLISTLYLTAQDETAWDAVSVHLRKLTDASISVFAVRDWSDQRVLNHYHSGFDKSFYDIYEDYYFAVDVYTAGLAKLPMGRFHAQHQFLADKNFLNSEVYTDYASKNDIRYLAGCIIDIPNTGKFGQMTCIRNHRGEEFSDDILETLNLLPVHFRQALLLGRKIAAHKNDLRSRERIIDRMPEAVFVLSADCKILYRNTMAEDTLSASAFLRVTNNRLALRNPGPTTRLKRIVKNACDAASGEALAGGNAFRVNDDEGGVEIVAFPFRFRRDGDPILYERPSALVIANARPGKKGLNTETLRMLYDLTPGEAAVVGFLSLGLTPSEIAAERSVGLNTVRAQIRSIHQKTGCHNQAQLLSRVLGGISRIP